MGGMCISMLPIHWYLLYCRNPAQAASPHLTPAALPNGVTYPQGHTYSSSGGPSPQAAFALPQKDASIGRALPPSRGSDAAVQSRFLGTPLDVGVGRGDYSNASELSTGLPNNGENF